MAERQKRSRVTVAEHYQRSKAEELSAKASDPVGKVKHPGTTRGGKGSTPHSQQQEEDADLHVEEVWEKVTPEDLEKVQVVLLL